MSSGRDRTISASGTMMAIDPMPRTIQASRQPTKVMMPWTRKGKKSGPIAVPVDAIATARPRFRTNHLGTMATVSISAPPIMVSAPSAPKST